MLHNKSVLIGIKSSFDFRLAEFSSIFKVFSYELRYLMQKYFYVENFKMSNWLDKEKTKDKTVLLFLCQKRAQFGLLLP